MRANFYIIEKLLPHNKTYKEVVMNIHIRDIDKSEYSILEDFLYEAIYIPEGMQRPEKDIIKSRQLQVYVKNFGESADDNALVAEHEGRIIGACWTRIMDDYGHVDDNTPSLAISLFKEYRGKEIGTQLLIRMLKKLKEKGYEQTSLSVQKENFAFKLYKKVGYEIVHESDDEYIMVYNFIKNNQGE